MVAEFIETSAEARRGFKALEAPHRSMTALDPTMVLLDPIIQMLVGAVFDPFVQLGPDGARVAIVAVRRDARRNDAGRHFG